jgi:hypothetical protein
VAEQFTVVVPSANVLSETGEQSTAGLVGLASLAVAANETAAPDALVASTVISAGRLRTGASSSQLMTVPFTTMLVIREPVAGGVLFLAPVAVKVMVEEKAPSESVRAGASVTFELVAAPSVPKGCVVQLLGSVELAGTVAVSSAALKVRVQVIVAEFANTFAAFALLWREMASVTDLEGVVPRHTSSPK